MSASQVDMDHGYQPVKKSALEQRETVTMIYPAEHDATPEPVASFIVPGEPVSKSRARFTKQGSRTFAYTPQKTHDGEKAVAKAFLNAMPPEYEPDGEYHFGVSAKFFNATRQRRDVDNMLKLILDGLNGVAWVDDNQVTEVIGRKSYEWEKEAARTEVTIYRVGKIAPPSGKCKFCGETFLLYRSTPARKYCSRACDQANRSAKRMTTCIQCKKTFDPGRDQSGKKFCGDECKNECNRTEVECFVCGGTFHKSNSQVHHRNVCSDACRDVRNASCKHGHPRSLHTATRPDGRIYCNECNRLRAARRKASRAA